MRPNSPLTPPRSVPIASYSTYRQAEEAVNLLSQRAVSVAGVTIVAGDLRFVEHVAGRRDRGSAIMEGATSGAGAGVVVGFVLGVFSPITPAGTAPVLAFWGLLLGAVVGALVGALGHVLGDGRPDLAPKRTLGAGRYDVVAPPEIAGDTRRVLEEAMTSRAA
jgi:uncharacterized protein YqgC (DUF456 family)